MEHIILCADDYGQNLAISQAIIGLLSEKHLSATSCLVTSPLWPNCAKQLESFKNQADLGLHFNLTDGTPLSKELPTFLPLKTLILKTQFRQIKKQAIIAELHAQLDRFVETLGQLPDFVDGHQHVHQFPVVREALFEVYEQRLRASKAYLRCTFDSQSLYRFRVAAYLKRLIIQLCGGITFKREVVKRNIPHNSTFAGIYNFSDSLDYPHLFPQFLKQVQNGGLIMCHPALFSNEEDSEMANARHQEYLYFSSHAYTQACEGREIKVTRFKNILQS